MKKDRLIKDYLIRPYLVKQYKAQLKAIVYGMPLIEGVPDTIKKRELMKNLTRYGYCFIGETYKNSQPNGKKVLDNAIAGGVAEYDDDYEYCTYANPINDSKKYIIGEDCVMIRLTDTYLRFNSIIRRYALLLADADITTDMTVISLRAKNILSGIADDSTQKKSIEKFFENLKDGIVTHIMSRSMMSNVQSLELGGNKDDAIASTILKNNILRQFYRDIGLSMSKDKSQAILSDETEADYQHLRVNQNIIISSIQEGLDECNKMFGWNATVRVNPIYEIKEKEMESEVEDNDNSSVNTEDEGNADSE